MCLLRIDIIREHTDKVDNIFMYIYILVDLKILTLQLIFTTKRTLYVCKIKVPVKKQ